MCKACWEWTVLPPGLVLTAPHEAWSPISGLSRHVAVVVLVLVCVGYIWRPMRDKKSSVCGNCCDARGRLLVPFLVVFLALVVVSAGKGAWSSLSVATWVGFASNMAENAETQTGGISAAEVGRKRRIAAQGWLTRASKKLETVVAQPEIDMSELLDAIEQFDSRLTAYDSAQSEFELYLDSDQLIAEIDKSADYRDNVRVPRIAASKLFASPIQNDDKHSDHAGSNASSSHVDVKLPKLNLPYFGGDVREWTSFWEQFETAIDNSDLPDVSKFTYVRSLLKSDAKQCIEGLSLSGAHYSTACDLLKNRYGRPEQIIFTHVQDLLNLSIPAKCSVKQLWQLNDELLAHVRSLESLGVSGTQYGVILTAVIVSRLPEDIHLEWPRKGAGHESDLKWLLTFLESDIKCRERSQVYEDKGSSAAPQVRKERVKVIASTASALQSSSSSGRGCLVCGKNHATERCFKLTRVSLNECRELLRSHGLCYRCLGKGHIARGCASTCARCNGRHHRVLCLRGDNGKHGDSGQPQDTRELNVSDSSTSQSNVAVNETNDTSVKSGTATAHSSASLSVLGATTQNRYRVLLQTLRVTVRGGRVVDDVTILLDTGCDRSYISSALVCRVEPRWVESQMLSYAPFGSKESGKCALRNVFSLDLVGTSKNHPLLVTEVPVICAPMHRSEVREELLESFGALGFADGVLDVGDVQPDILIGLDQYHRFVKPSIVSSDPEGLFAQASVFGWILFGSFTSPSTGFAVCAVSHQLFCVERQLDGIVPELWSLEAIGISPGKEELVDPVLSSFKKDVAFTDGRYVTGFPWQKGSKYRLLDNEKLARKRLCNLNHKLSGNPDLKARYDGVFQQMLDSGVIEKVPLEEIECSRPKFYMPHRPVVREDKLTTKVRPVFDASAKGYNQVSLNDCMEVGPCLLSNLTEILVRFRRWPVAVTADIEKAFHQISILEEDRDVHRFLWQPDDDVMTMRFTRVPFGNCCSPFLLNATIQHHLSSFPPSPAVNELQDNLYVDDFLSGADSEAESGALIRDSISIMDQAGMSLSKWCSNSSSVADLLEHEFDNKFLTADTVKVLGLRWLAEEDCFTFDCIGLPEGLVITKRVVLSYISRVFDPLGLLTPFTMMSKCLFQELWKTGVGWDEEIPVEFVKWFQMWMNDLSLLQMWKIPRSYFPVAWRDLQQLQLEGFGDASSTGYGACVYLRAQMPDGTYTSSLVLSRLWQYHVWSSWDLCFVLGWCLLCIKRWNVQMFLSGVGRTPWWHFVGSEVVPPSGSSLWLTEYERSRIWLIPVNGSTAVASSTLLIWSPEGWELRSWCLQNFGWRVLSSWFILGQNHAIQLKLLGALFCLLSARMLLRVLLCLWVLILWIQQSSPWVVGGPCAKPYVLLPGWGGLWEMPVVLFLSVWRVSCPLWSWRKQRWSWYSRYNVGIFPKSVHLCRMVGLSRSPPHCTSSSRSLMVKVLWELAVGFSSLTCPMTPSIPSWFPNLTWQFFWFDSSISCSSMVVWMCFSLLWGINFGLWVPELWPSRWKSVVCRVRSRMQLHQVNLQLLFQQCVWGLLSLLQSQVWTTLVPCIVATNLGRSCTCCCLRVVLWEQCTWSLSPFSPVLRHWWPSVGL